MLLDGTTGFKAFTLPESSNIQVEFLDYVFIVVGPGGIYPPDYDVTGNLQQALSVTMWDGDITQMRSLMGMFKTSIIPKNLNILHVTLLDYQILSLKILFILYFSLNLCTTFIILLINRTDRWVLDIRTIRSLNKRLVSFIATFNTL